MGKGDRRRGGTCRLFHWDVLANMPIYTLRKVSLLLPHHFSQYILVIGPHLPVPFIVCGTRGVVALPAQRRGGFAPGFGLVQWAGDAMQSAISRDGVVVLVSAGDLGLQLIEATGRCV